MDKRRILVIAGSDSSGGAGLEADQKVIAAHICYAMTATTALTAQNTQGVSAIHHTPPHFVSNQIDACISDVGVDVVKIGMLASSETVDVVADALESYSRPITVVDPVMISTSGAQLLSREAVTNLRTRILPLTTVLTPNIPEARLLLQDSGFEVPEVTTLDDMVQLTKALHKLGPKYVLVKGGHLALERNGDVSDEKFEDEKVADVLFDGRQAVVYETDLVRSKNTHGTGCSLASAIACGIALSEDENRSFCVPEAIENACRYIEAGISTSFNIGHGNGPINHFHSLSLKSLPLATSSLRRFSFPSANEAPQKGSHTK